MGAPNATYGWALSYRLGGAGAEALETVHVTDLQGVPGALQELVARLGAKLAPAATVRNHQQLCGASGSMRRFCLFLVDSTDASTGAALVELEASRSAYAQ